MDSVCGLEHWKKRVFSTCSTNLLSATRSTIFETKLRFEMGLNELRSLESSVGFFSNGTVIAFFWLAGRTRWSNDALHILVMTGAMTLLTCFTSHVGTGSRRQCFDGTFLSSAAISPAVVGLNVDIVSGTARSVMTGD